jgi:hypothetical protein
LPDLALILYLRLGGHVELTNYKSFISPLPGYVETKAGAPESLMIEKMTLQLVRFDQIPALGRASDTEHRV